MVQHFSQQSFITIQSNNASSDCIEIVTTGGGSLVAIGCDMTRDSFLCKRDSDITTGTKDFA